MGVSELEAGLLSGQAAAEEFPATLRHSTEHGGSEFHLPPTGEGDDGSKMDRGNTRRLSFWREGAPGHHAYQAAEGHGRLCATLSEYYRAPGAGGKAWPPAVPVAAESKSRLETAGGVSGHSAACCRIGL